MNDSCVVVHYLFNLDRGLCDFSTAAASVLIGLPDPDPGAKSSSNPADFGAVFWSVDPF